MARIEGTGGRDDLNGTNNDDVMILKAGDDTAHGRDGDDVIRGEGGDDHLYGQAGADTLFGGDGYDVLYGGAGRDVLNGGSGADLLYGGDGADLFVFNSATEDDVPGRGQTNDWVVDFRRAENDRIDLSAIDANWNQAGNQAFRFLGEQAFTGHAGELIFEQVTYDSEIDTRIAADVDGDMQADLYIALYGDYNLLASDFIL
jgi:Ca2+-binding RTX toxin-like protein